MEKIWIAPIGAFAAAIILAIITYFNYRHYKKFKKNCTETQGEIVGYDYTCTSIEYHSSTIYPPQIKFMVDGQEIIKKATIATSTVRERNYPIGTIVDIMYTKEDDYYEIYLKKTSGFIIVPTLIFTFFTLFALTIGICLINAINVYL
ncbi:MAG: hypothetical protein RSA99_01430 [Oscillospiraceae bacterium]